MVLRVTARLLVAGSAVRRSTGSELQACWRSSPTRSSRGWTTTTSGEFAGMHISASVSLAYLFDDLSSSKGSAEMALDTFDFYFLMFSSLELCWRVAMVTESS